MVIYIRFLCPWDFPGKNTRMGTVSFSRGSSWPRDHIHVSCIGWQVLYHWQAPGKPIHYAAAAAKSHQLCPTLCDPIDSSPTGSSVPGTLQARTLWWVAISFSNTLCYIHAIEHCIIISKNETHCMWPSGKTCRIYCYLKNSTRRTAIAYVGYIQFHK